MKPLAIALAVSIFSVMTAANAQIYQWKDESGRTVISDKPPVGRVHQQRKVATESSTTNSSGAKQKSLAERDLEFRKRQQEARENSEKAEKEQAATAEKARNCENARRQLRALESGERISMRDEKGERYILDDAQRDLEIGRVRQSIQANCAP